MNLKRYLKKFALRLSMCNYLSLKMRRGLARLGGVKIGNSFVGQQVVFDTDYPQNIEIGDHCVIGMRSTILCHYVYPVANGHRYRSGHVKLGNNVFLGANVVIAAPVTIGDNVIVGAGAVVTKSIPSGEVWGGVPARYIKKFEPQEG